MCFGSPIKEPMSLSEKVRAGLEIAALLRRLAGLELPVYIDNTESIVILDRQLLPAQTILSKVVKGAALSVMSTANAPALEKAG